MSDTQELIVNGAVFNYPKPGTEPGWGEDATDWAVAITDAVNSLLGEGDIIETTFQLTNNQSIATDVNGLLFNNTTVRSAKIDYTVYINTSTNELIETGVLYLQWKSDSTTWVQSQSFVGDVSGLEFSITTGGQVQYTTTNISGTGYQGRLTFKADSIIDQ